MLQTQIRIGRQISRDHGEWDDILDTPTVETENKKKEEITNYVLCIVFDLDAGCIRVNRSCLSEYDPEQSTGRFFNIKIQGGNNKAVYTCVEPKKLEQIRKSFFGIADKKTDAEPSTGQFTEAINKDFSSLQSTTLYEALTAIFQLREDFEIRYANESKKNLDEGEPALLKEIKLRANDRIVLVATSVIWSEKGWESPVLFSDIPGYQEFLKQKFLGNNTQEVIIQIPTSPVERLCYATGLPSKDVGELGISERYSLNKMFVTTTINYAGGWDKSGFGKNYQIDHETQKYLERGSKYLLEHYKTRIADVSHCIIPQLFSRDETTDLETALTRLKRKSDLLFQFESFQRLTEDLEEDTNAPYWITFLGFESDGNFFKTINIIKDVSRTHFENLIEIFRQTHIAFSSLPGVDWAGVMSVGKERRELNFNLFTVYGLIPIRKEKEKKNQALALFKQVLEKRSVNRQKLFNHFKELILCHRFDRYNSYTNIYPNSAFDFAIRNAVFQYLAFIHVLNQFNLITPMEENEIEDIQEKELDTALEEQTSSEYQQKIEQFFVRMSYKTEHKSLFYLGRVLSAVARAQVKSNHTNKPVLKKLNYNGMDKAAIQRLYADLREKTQQYSIHKFTESNLSRFTMSFNSLNWTMKPDEALFFILSGYSFYVSTAKKEPITD